MCICFEIIQTSEFGIVERCGRFNRLLEPGCVLFCWPFEHVAGKVSIRVQELFVTCETKTSDNVFVTVNVSLQYMAVREKIYAAFYTLEDPLQQMRSYVFDVLRAALCQMTLDQSFESKEEISHSIKSHLEEVMHGYGYTILNAVVTDLSPDARVREAMNEINASKRLKEVAEQRAEGEKVIKVKRAQAESESMYLSGCGVARQRKAIMDGLKETITEFGDKVKDTSTKEIMDMIVLNQYFDTLQEIGHNPVTKTVFLPSDNDKLRTSILQADAGIQSFLNLQCPDIDKPKMHEEILEQAKKQTGNNNLFMPNTDNITELCDEYEKTLKIIDELCDQVDPESTPFVSKYKARDIIDDIVKRLEATYTVSIIEGKKDVARIMDCNVANLRVKLGIICWDVEEPHNCQIELDLAAEFLCPGYVKQITDLTNYEENVTPEDGIKRIEESADTTRNYEDNFMEPPYPKDDSNSADLAVNQMKCLNMLGILWAGRGYKGRAFYYLQAVKSIYERTKIKSSEIESIYTHNLFYLAQAYVQIGDARKSSYFCRETLQRQFNNNWNNPREALDWAKNCAGISDFYMSVGEYVKCSLALASTDYALNVCAKLLNSNDEKNNEIFELLSEVRIELYRRWSIFDVNILKRAYERQCMKEHLMYIGEEWIPDSPIVEEDIGELKMVPNTLELISIPQTNSILPPLPPDDSISSAKLIPKREFFKGLPVTETPYINEGDIETFEVARLVFLRGMANAENAKKHFVLDGFVTDHVNLLQNQSKMYHYLSVFETDKKRKLAMEQRRLDMLLPVINSINKNAFDSLHKQLSYELGECYLSAVENKIDKLRDANGEVDIKKLKKADISKVNSYAKGALAMFAHYSYLFAKSEDRNKYSKNSPFEDLSLAELLTAVCTDPDESLISENELRLYLNAIFLSSRAMQKVIPFKESTNQERASYLIGSLKNYSWLLEKGKIICQNKKIDIDDIFRSEIEVCKNMLELLPSKIDRIVYKGESGLSI